MKEKEITNTLTMSEIANAIFTEFKLQKFGKPVLSASLDIQIDKIHHINEYSKVPIAVCATYTNKAGYETRFVFKIRLNRDEFRKHYDCNIRDALAWIQHDITDVGDIKLARDEIKLASYSSFDTTYNFGNVGRFDTDKLLDKIFALKNEKNTNTKAETPNKTV